MIENFQKLGLSYYEAKALETLLKEALTAKELSKKSKIPLGKVYSIILSLERKGLTKVTSTHPQKFYVENASESLKNLISNKEKEHENLVNSIKEFATKIDTMKSKTPKFFDIGTTMNDNQRLQLRSFEEAEKEVCQILNINHRPTDNRIIKTTWEKSIVNATNRGVVFRSIYPNTAKVPRILEELNKDYPEKFNVRKSDLTFPRCDIIDKKKVLIKLMGSDPASLGGVIFIENEKLARNLQEIFEEFWKDSSSLH